MKFILNHTLQNEIDHAGNMASKLEWFKKNNYKIKLPQGITSDSTDVEIKNAVEEEFLSTSKIYKKLKPELDKLIKKEEKTIKVFFCLFEYDIPETVNVFFTIYGPGGSYAPPDKIVVMLKDSPEWVLQMIVHETIHIIIEEPFIKKYEIAHWDKESIVDALCMSEKLTSICPDYKPQKQARRLSSELIENLQFKEKASLIKK